MTDHGEAELSDRIDALAVESQFGEGNRRFIPEGCLETIITREAIEQVLREAYEDSDDGDPAQHQALVAFIHERAIKLFAIALSINLEDATLYNGMKLLHQNNFTDDNLPIKPWNDDHEFSKLDAKFWNRRQVTSAITSRRLLPRITSLPGKLTAAIPSGKSGCFIRGRPSSWLRF
jgi:hypothetical protein